MKWGFTTIGYVRFEQLKSCLPYWHISCKSIHFIWCLLLTKSDKQNRLNAIILAFFILNKEHISMFCLFHPSAPLNCCISCCKHVWKVVGSCKNGLVRLYSQQSAWPYKYLSTFTLNSFLMPRCIENIDTFCTICTIRSHVSCQKDAFNHNPNIKIPIFSLVLIYSEWLGVLVDNFLGMELQIKNSYNRHPKNLWKSKDSPKPHNSSSCSDSDYFDSRPHN